MKSIERFVIPFAPESTVELPLGVTLIDCIGENEILESDDEGAYGRTELAVYYLDPKETDQTVRLIFYVMSPGDAVPDAFPGQYFKTAILAGGDPVFIFFRKQAEKREPVVVEVPDAKPKKEAA